MSALATRTGSINLGQGFPDTDGPRQVSEAAVAAIRAGHNQYPPGPGIPEPAPGRRRPPAPLLRARLRPRRRGPRHGRGHRGHRRHPPGPVRAGRRGDPVRAVLRPVRGGRGDGRGQAAGRHPPSARLPLRSRRAGRRRHPEDPARPAQLAAQPHRQGVRAGRARRDRPDLRGARPAGGHRRGVRAPRLRRRPRASGHPARHAGAHDHHLLGGQDVLVHRLEDRLGVRSAGPAERRADGQAVPHLRQRGAVPVRHRRGVAARRRLLRGPGRRPAGQARPPVRRPGEGGLHRLPPGRQLLRHHRHPLARPDTGPGAGAGRDDGDGAAFCRSLPDRCGVVAVPNVVFYDDVAAGRSLVRFAFCKRLDVLDEAVERLLTLRPEPGRAEVGR